MAHDHQEGSSPRGSFQFVTLASMGPSLFRSVGVFFCVMFYSGRVA